MITIELTQEEIQQLLQLIDISVKAGGLQNAKVAIPIVDKIVSAANTPKE
jgi:hypothetical protein